MHTYLTLLSFVPGRVSKIATTTPTLHACPLSRNPKHHRVGGDMFASFAACPVCRLFVCIPAPPPPQQQGTRHPIRAAVRPATGTAGRREPLAAGCTAAAVRGQKLIRWAASFQQATVRHILLSWSEYRHHRGWAYGSLTHSPTFRTGIDTRYCPYNRHLSLHSMKHTSMCLLLWLYQPQYTPYPHNLPLRQSPSPGYLAEVCQHTQGDSDGGWQQQGAFSCFVAYKH